MSGGETVGVVSIRQVIAFVGRGSAPPAPAPAHSPKPDGSSLRIGCFEIRMECVETRNIDGSGFELSANFEAYRHHVLVHHGEIGAFASKIS